MDGDDALADPAHYAVGAVDLADHPVDPAPRLAREGGPPRRLPRVRARGGRVHGAYFERSHDPKRLSARETEPRVPGAGMATRVAARRCCTDHADRSGKRSSERLATTLLAQGIGGRHGQQTGAGAAQVEPVNSLHARESGQLGSPAIVFLHRVGNSGGT